MEQDLYLRIATSPFISEKSRKYWSGIERKIQEEYGFSSLPEFVEDELSNGKHLVSIVRGLGVNYLKFYRLLYKIGFVPLNLHSRFSPSQKRTDAEQRAKKKYNMPLFEYFLMRYHTNDLGSRKIAKENGVSHQTILNWMRELGIQIKVLGKGYPSPLKGKTYEEFYGEKRAREIKDRLSMYSKGQSPFNKGKTLEELCGIKRAQGIRRQLSGKNNPNFGNHKTLEELYGQEKAKEIKRKMSESRKRLSCK